MHHKTIIHSNFLQYHHHNPPTMSINCFISLIAFKIKILYGTWKRLCERKLKRDSTLSVDSNKNSSNGLYFFFISNTVINLAHAYFVVPIFLLYCSFVHPLNFFPLYIPSHLLIFSSSSLKRTRLRSRRKKKTWHRRQRR